MPSHRQKILQTKEEADMIRCSCLCGGVRLQINGELFAGVNCHCNGCQKTHGGAFRSRALARAADFEVVSGVDLIKYHESTTGVDVDHPG